MVQRLGPSFGMSPVQTAATEYAERHTRNRTSNMLNVTSTGSLTTGAGIASVRDHTFHGE
jgi:hypothetical protein